MGRRKSIEEEELESTAGDQMDLIDVSPETLAEIKPLAREYRKVVKQRVKIQAKETDLKQQILDLIKGANLARLPDGSIRFKCDGMTISVTPRDELVKVKEEGGDEDE